MNWFSHGKWTSGQVMNSTLRSWKYIQWRFHGPLACGWACGHGVAYLPDFKFPRRVPVLPTCATCTMPDNVILEMGGPLAGVLHQQVLQCLRKYSYVINLKIKRFAFKHSPCWCSTVLYPSTTHHRYLRQKGQKSSPLLQASSSPCDLLALILGARSRRETVKATDEIEDDAIRTVKMQMRGWIVVDIKDVFDLKAGTFNKEWMKKSVRDREGNEDFLGFLRIRWINFRWC